MRTALDIEFERTQRFLRFAELWVYAQVAESLGSPNADEIRRGVPDVPRSLTCAHVAVSN